MNAELLERLAKCWPKDSVWSVATPVPGMLRFATESEPYTCWTVFHIDCEHEVQNASGCRIIEDEIIRQGYILTPRSGADGHSYRAVPDKEDDRPGYMTGTLLPSRTEAVVNLAISLWSDISEQ